MSFLFLTVAGNCWQQVKFLSNAVLVHFRGHGTAVILADG